MKHGKLENMLVLVGAEFLQVGAVFGRAVLGWGVLESWGRRLDQHHVQVGWWCSCRHVHPEATLFQVF
jgi:hypothetical protein